MAGMQTECQMFSYRFPLSQCHLKEEKGVKTQPPQTLSYLQTVTVPQGPHPLLVGMGGNKL